jgi:hypothetical protein
MLPGQPHPACAMFLSPVLAIILKGAGYVDGA